MLFSRKLLQFVKFKLGSKHVEEQEVSPANETSQFLEEEVVEAIEKVSKFEVSSLEYNRGTGAIKNLCEAIEKHDRGNIERKKLELQIEEARKRRAVDWGVMTPKIVAILAYAGVTCVLLALERQTPLSMRWLKAMETLLAPKGL